MYRILKILYLFCLALFLFGLKVDGQTREELEKSIVKTSEEINLTNRLLDQNVEQQKQGLNHLLVIQRRIGLRESIIGDLDKQVDIIDRQIDQKDINIKELEKGLEKLRAEYARMIYFAYKNRNKYDQLMFILASEDFNQAYRRMKYFEQYSKYRKKQANQIFITRKNLEYEIETLTEIRQEKTDIINKKEQEKGHLRKEQRNERLAIDRLKHQQQELRSKLANAQRIKDQLKQAIAELIEREAEKNTYYKKLNETEARISADFLASKGNHIWPVNSYVIVSHFGIHNHPVLKGVKINNDGIDLRVLNDLRVRSIFEGEVRKVFAIPGANISVIIRHGHYLTLYSNLTNVQVKVGDNIKKSDYIGDVFSGRDTDQNQLLHFRIYEENKKLNPVDWLSKL